MIEKEEFADARRVLEEILRLIPDDHPRAELFRGRLYHDKMAYSFCAEGRYEEALGLYIKAAKYTWKGHRSHIKTRGAIALVRYLALKEANVSGHQGVAIDLISDMEGVLVDAQEGGFPDVEEAAAKNLELMKAGRFSPWSPFETT